jgi:hypothetical protein
VKNRAFLYKARTVLLNTVMQYGSAKRIDRYLFLNNKLHQNIVYNVKVTKNGNCFSMVGLRLEENLAFTGKKVTFKSRKSSRFKEKITVRSADKFGSPTVNKITLK